MGDTTTGKGHHVGYIPAIDQAQVVRRFETAEDVTQLLQAVCDEHRRVTIYGPEIEPIHGSFHALENGHLKLRFNSSESIRSHTLCTIQFTYSNHQCYCITVTLNSTIDEATGDFIVSARMPSRIDEVEARWNRRIRVSSDANVVASVKRPGKPVLVAELVDIGRGGADISIGETTQVLPVGESALLSISCQGETVEMIAELRWKQGHRHGFSFTYRQESGEYFIPESLERLLCLLSND